MSRLYLLQKSECQICSAVAPTKLPRFSARSYALVSNDKISFPLNCGSLYSTFFKMKLKFKVKADCEI